MQKIKKHKTKKKKKFLKRITILPTHPTHKEKEIKNKKDETLKKNFFPIHAQSALCCSALYKAFHICPHPFRERGQISAAALHIAPDVGGDGQSGTCAYRIVAGGDMHRLLQLCEEKHYICGKHSAD